MASTTVISAASAKAITPTVATTSITTAASSIAATSMSSHTTSISSTTAPIATKTANSGEIIFDPTPFIRRSTRGTLERHNSFLTFNLIISSISYAQILYTCFSSNFNTSDGSVQAIVTRSSIAIFNAAIIAASCGSISKFNQLSRRITPFLTKSILRQPNSIKCNGVTIVICLQDTALVQYAAMLATTSPQPKTVLNIIILPSLGSIGKRAKILPKCVSSSLASRQRISRSNTSASITASRGGGSNALDKN
uniref:Uncharacterized protein n=1 Tax=Glossina pallidipes TaxID=7398 RepID=A0A1A9ZS40_GLOPL